MRDVITVGIDAHSQVHAAAAVDSRGRVVAQLETGTDRSELGRMLTWVQALPVPREIAVEGAKGFGRPLTLLLLAAGEEVVDVPTHLTAHGRRTSRRRGKDDEGDAIIIARVAIREDSLPRMDAAHLNTDMKLLVDARDQLVQEQIRVRNRLHALLIGLCPGHRAVTGALTSKAALQRARVLAMKERTTDPVRAHLALAAIKRLAALGKETVGEPVSPSAVTGLVAVREINRARAGGDTSVSIVHNVITSAAVREIVLEADATPVRTRVGHSFIKAEMARAGAVFGGEHSAHYYFRDFWFADTGMLAAMHVLAALGEQDAPLSELCAEYERYVASGEINSTVTDQAAVVEQVRAWAQVRGATTDVLDGLTVSSPAGDAPMWWFNVRASNTEPLLRLNVEAADRETMQDVRDELLALIRSGAETTGAADAPDEPDNGGSTTAQDAGDAS